MQPLNFDDDPLEKENGREAGRPFADALEALFRRRRLIGICVASALAVSALVSFQSRPMYRATTLLNVDRERANPLDLGPGAARDASSDPDSFATETQLIKNREVAERVAARRKLVARKGSGEQAAADSTPDEREPLVTRALKIQRKIEVVPVRGTNLIELSFVAADPQMAADTANAVAEAYVDWKLESKFRIIGQASKFLALQIEEAKQALSEKEQRLLALGRQKDILTIAPQSSVTLEKLTALGQDSTRAMADRISREARYNELQTANPDSLPESLTTSAIQQQRNDLARLEREYADKLSVFKPEWPAMQALQAQIEKARQTLEVTTREAVAKAREAAKAEYQTALRREESLKSATQRQREEAMSLSRDAIDYNNLRVEAETQRALVDNLLKRSAEMQVLLRLQGERLSNIRIVETALPPTAPFKPSYPKNALFGLLAGLASGVGLAMTLDSLDRSLHSPEQVTRLLRLPVLGVIPPAQAAMDRGYGYGYDYDYSYGDTEKSAATEPSGTKPSGVKAKRKVSIELLPHELPRSVVAEAYRSFRTSLLLSRADGVRTLVVTSAVPLEGKSSTATNLAIVLGQLGRRVLLVDSDLRRPRLHEILNVSNRVGLVSVLAARTDPHEAILHTSMPNVSVLPAGPTAPDPSGLLSSEAMKRFLSRAVEEFDNVIFDSPPILASADGILLGNLTDGVVLCVQAARTPRELVARARDELLRSRVHILGVLMNNVKDESRSGAAYRTYAPPEKIDPKPGAASAPQGVIAAS